MIENLVRGAHFYYPAIVLGQVWILGAYYCGPNADGGELILESVGLGIANHMPIIPHDWLFFTEAECRAFVEGGGTGYAVSAMLPNGGYEIEETP